MTTKKPEVPSAKSVQEYVEGAIQREVTKATEGVRLNPEAAKFCVRALKVLAACEEYSFDMANAIRGAGFSYTADFLRTLATLMQEGREK